MTSAEGRQGRSAEAHFARRLRVIRETLGLSQADLANRITKAGMSMPQQTVARIESGKRSIRLDEAGIISDILQVTLQEMMSDPIEGLAGDEVSIVLEDSVNELVELEELISANYEQLEESKARVRELEDERATLFQRKAREEVRLDALHSVGAYGHRSSPRPPVGTRIAAARLSAGYNTLVLVLRAGLGAEAEPTLKAIERNDFSSLSGDEAHQYIRKLAHALDMNGDDLATQYETERSEDE
ncbi:helix-turn-helix transcriptional regulator [Streptomyces apocyni]|uniref:helix-turn-helix transcriptional regulator n=1 Tax=Streptomyces apocyni TaxID=2654677 RepID=UPI0018D1A751|nr:helix-turn-helix transcriptional regulator [Streptomyces apocyni]